VPVIACPQCPTQLKVPAGVSGNTKCPKCGTVFPVKTPPAFEVVDDPPPAPSVPPPPTKTEAEEPDFEIVDDEPQKRVTAQPAKSRVHRDDDEEDDDDRPKKKPKKKTKKPRYKDDEDEYWQPRPGSRGAMGKGEAGAFLISISFWLNMATFGLLTLYAVVMWIGAVALTSSSPSSRRSSRGIGGGSEDFQAVMDLIIILPGLLGLCAWLVGLVGSAIAIAGPARSRGMAIVATLTASVHLLLVGVLFIVLLDAINSATARELGLGSPAWLVVATTLPVLDIFFPILFTRPSLIGVTFLLAFLTACLEVARLVFMQLTVKGLARAAGDYAAAEKTQFGLILTAIIIAVVAFVILMVYFLFDGGGIGPKMILNLAMAIIFLTFLAYTAMMLVPGMAAHQTKNACGRRG